MGEGKNRENLRMHGRKVPSKQEPQGLQSQRPSWNPGFSPAPGLGVY